MPVVEAPTGITFVGYENQPGVSTENRVQHFLSSDRASWYNHVNVTVHDRGGHFIPGKSRTVGLTTCAAPSIITDSPNEEE